MHDKIRTESQLVRFTALLGNKKKKKSKSETCSEFVSSFLLGDWWSHRQREGSLAVFKIKKKTKKKVYVKSKNSTKHNLQFVKQPSLKKKDQHSSSLSPEMSEIRKNLCSSVGSFVQWKCSAHVWNVDSCIFFFFILLIKGQKHETL